VSCVRLQRWRTSLTVHQRPRPTLQQQQQTPQPHKVSESTRSFASGRVCGACGSCCSSLQEASSCHNPSSCCTPHLSDVLDARAARPHLVRTRRRQLARRRVHTLSGPADASSLQHSSLSPRCSSHAPPGQFPQPRLWACEDARELHPATRVHAFRVSVWLRCCASATRSSSLLTHTPSLLLNPLSCPHTPTCTRHPAGPLGTWTCAERWPW
jgi:hypothetical protein